MHVGEFYFLVVGIIIMITIIIKVVGLHIVQICYMQNQTRCTVNNNFIQTSWTRSFIALSLSSKSLLNSSESVRIVNNSLSRTLDTVISFTRCSNNTVNRAIKNNVAAIGYRMAQNNNWNGGNGQTSTVRNEGSALDHTPSHLKCTSG